MDALFLSALLAEARVALEGARVQRVDPDGPEGVAVTCHGGTGRIHVFIGWEAWGPRWYFGPDGTRRDGGSRFAAAAAANLRGGRVTGFVRPGMDRAVGLEVAWRRGPTTRRLVLWAFLWPGGRNAVLVDADTGLVIAAARPGPWRPGAPFAVSPQRGDALVEIDTPEKFEARLRAAAPGSPAEIAMTRAFPGIGPILGREVAFRAARDAEPSTGSATLGGAGPVSAGPGALWRAFAEAMAETRAGRFDPRILLGPDGEPQALSPLVLQHAAAERQRAFPTANAAAAAYFEARRTASAFGTARVAIERALRHARARLVRRVEKLETELHLHRQAAAHRQMGEILVANQRAVPRGASEVILPDPYGPLDAMRTIALDPALSVAANVERYFKRSRRGARGETVAAQRLGASRCELERVADLDKALADATSPDALRDLDAAVRRLGRVPGDGSRPPFAVRHSPGTGRGGRRTANGERARPSAARAGRQDTVARVARRFVSTDGLAILVGRNNAANDELTLHVARPDDVWLHVEGYGGSHVVIRRGDRADVPRQTLVEAAQLAAYYSQARGQRKVPVHYALRKHVRKPKGAKPGLVTITQEKTIFVTADPGLVRRLAAAVHAPDD